MKAIKKGDTVICNDDSKWKFLGLNKYPKANQEYKVTEIDGDYLVLEGMDQNDCWHISHFDKKKNLTEILAESFLGSVVEERPEYERVFTLSAKF